MKVTPSPLAKPKFLPLLPVLACTAPQAAQDCGTIGRIICEKAGQLAAEQVYVGGSGRHRSKLAELMSGSVVHHVKQHCKVPVTVVVQQGDGVSAEELAGC